MSTTLRDGGVLLSEGQRVALVRLLEDDDPAVREPVRSRILACGPGAAVWLRPHLQDEDPVVRGRVRELLEYLERQEADTVFLGYCLGHGEDLDLEEASWLLARTRYPGMNVEAYEALLESYATVLRAEAGGEKDVRKALERLSEHLFVKVGYSGNAKQYYDPENSYLNRVMDRRTGNPISLCALYLFVPRRLGLPVVGVGMPGHFLCRSQTPTEEVYIDAFHGGRLLTRADCVKHLTRSSFGFQEEFLSPVTPRRMLLRMCGNLHQLNLHLRDKEEASRFQRYVVALSK